MSLDLFKRAALADVELRVQDSRSFLQEVPVGEASLVTADPAWRYDERLGAANPDEVYETMSMDDIAADLRAAYAVAAAGARLALWATWPKLLESLQRNKPTVFSQEAICWKPVTGGSWHKLNRRGAPNHGVGYHWIGASEPLLMYRKPGAATCDRSRRLYNAHASQITDHSEKPVGWMVDILERWTNPGDLVLDLYAGMAPMARACALTGRRYLGCEINPERAAEARARLQRCREQQEARCAS